MGDFITAGGARAQGAGGVHPAIWGSQRRGGRACDRLKPDVKVTIAGDRPRRLGGDVLPSNICANFFLLNWSMTSTSISPTTMKETGCSGGRRVESEMRFNLVVHDPGGLFNIIDHQPRNQARIEAYDTARRQRATARDARSVAAAVSNLQGNLSDKHDGSQRSKTAEVTAERNRRYENHERVVCGSKGTSKGVAAKASRATGRNTFMAKATASNPSSSCSSTNPQAVPLSISGAKPQGWPLRLPPLLLELVCTRPPNKRWLRESNLLRLRWLLRRMSTTCKFECRGRRWCQWIPDAPRRCRTMFRRTLGSKMQHQSSFSSGATAGTSVSAVSSRFRHRHVRACLGLAAWRVCRYERIYSGHRTALRGADAACRGASCGCRCVCGC